MPERALSCLTIDVWFREPALPVPVALIGRERAGREASPSAAVIDSNR